MEYLDIVDNLMFFQNFIGKEKVKNQLRFMNGSFPDFEKVYTEKRALSNKKDDSTLFTCETLATGVTEDIITQEEIDELLFLLIEDSLFNSYLYKIRSHNVILDDLGALPEVLKSWSVPKGKSIIQNVSKNNKGLDFIISSHRVYESEGKLESVRLLLLDKELLKIHKKNKEEIWVTYPTIVEFDFKRNLIHIRLKDVDNIESEFDEVGTMKGRVDRTLKFISSLKPSIKHEEFGNFRKSLYLIEEDVLSDKRLKAQEKLKTFDLPIDNFVKQVEEAFNPPQDNSLSSKDYISFAVLTIISSTLKDNQLGDVVGIKFRNTRQENTNKYAEVYISDKGNKCISSNELYWLNLPILQEQQLVEGLKVVKSLQSGYVVARLEISLNTANLRVLQRSDHPEVNRQPTDEKYSDMVDYLMNFLIFN